LKGEWKDKNAELDREKVNLT